MKPMRMMCTPVSSSRKSVASDSRSSASLLVEDDASLRRFAAPTLKADARMVVFSAGLSPEVRARLTCAGSPSSRTAPSRRAGAKRRHCGPSCERSWPGGPEHQPLALRHRRMALAKK